MEPVIAKAYLSPTLVLLAMDWAEGASRTDFLGFAVERIPGFLDLKSSQLAQRSWLPNRLGFNGPPKKGEPDFPSNAAPIQKFLWWDARLEGIAPGTTLSYRVSAVTGQAQAPRVEEGSLAVVEALLPPHEEKGIGTWFNRAVMSSQAFSRKLDALQLAGRTPTDAEVRSLREWLSNGMEEPLVGFIDKAAALSGAIYHLTDRLWLIPALARKAPPPAPRPFLVYDAHLVKDEKTGEKSCPNDGAIQALPGVVFRGRTKTNIMHDKFLVAGALPDRAARMLPERLTMGSANYTTEGLTEQANLVHSFESPELAELYLRRVELLWSNPGVPKTAQGAGWSRTISVGDAGLRVFFSPEPGKPGDDSESIETIVSAVHAARSSVIFCLFSPTDAALRDACFAAGDSGKMMFGLVNAIAKSEPSPKPTRTGQPRADELAALEIYHRSRDNKDVIGAAHFGPNPPEGFETERVLFPGSKPSPHPAVVIHHKFVVIDAETDSPVIYTGSANMSGNSAFKNDENLLEIKGAPRLARVYLAEFLRLYEHYRARAHAISAAQGEQSGERRGFALAPDRSWADAHYKPGTPEYKARLRMLGED